MKEAVVRDSRGKPCTTDDMVAHRNHSCVLKKRRSELSSDGQCEGRDQWHAINVKRCNGTPSMLTGAIACVKSLLKDVS